LRKRLLAPPAELVHTTNSAASEGEWGRGGRDCQVALTFSCSVTFPESPLLLRIIAIE